MRRHARGAALAVLLLPWAWGCKGSGSGVVALEGATLIDGSGVAPVRDALVLIKDGHIQAVARVNEIEVPRGAERVNLIGKTIIPGLIDAHARVLRWAGPRYLAWGVTTVRDFSPIGDSAIALRSELNLVAILGPRMYTAGGTIDGAPPTVAGASGAETPDAVRKAADARAVASADYIATEARLPPQLLGPLLDEAATLRLPVVVRPGRIDALAAARGGVVSLEQLSGIVQAAAGSGSYLRAYDTYLPGWTLEEKGWANLDSATIARTAQTLARTHIPLVPTLAMHEGISRMTDTTVATHPTMAEVPLSAPVVRDVGGLLKRSGWGRADFALFRKARARQDQFVREFARAGGVLAAGSGAASELLVPGPALHDELELLVAAGLSPLEAIGAATRTAAHLLHADSLGWLAPGKVADLVVLNGNPAADIVATREILWVMIRGRIVYPDSLRRSWGH